MNKIENPYAGLLGIKTIKAENGSATVEVKAEQQHANRLGYVHGGLMYSLADIAFEMASNSHEQDAVGITTNMQFHKAAKVGETIKAVAREVHLGRKLATYLIEVSTKEKLLATFTGTVYRMDKKD